MKKLFIVITALMMIAMHIKSDTTAAPVLMEKKITAEMSFQAASDDITEIKAMTYNIHRGINKSGRLDLDAVAEVIKASEADIIALQEVERFSVRTAFQDQIELLADKLSMYYAYGKSVNILNGQYGNGVLSKYPIVEYEVKELTSEGEQRTLLKTVININGNRIAFYSTHLGLDEKERSIQTEEILSAAEQESISIISGDFNTTVDKLLELSSVYKDSAYMSENIEKATFDDENISGRIDYIFVSDSFEVIEYDVLESDASDHYPAICTLMLKK